MLNKKNISAYEISISGIRRDGMAFVTTHLAVAKEVNDSINIVKDFSNYYLGTISPDCVHVRKEYNSNIKRYLQNIT